MPFVGVPADGGKVENDKLIRNVTQLIPFGEDPRWKHVLRSPVTADDGSPAGL